MIGTTSLAPEHVPSYISSRQSYRLRILREQYPSIPIQSLQRIFPLFDPLDLDLAISWSIPSTSRRGHTLLHSLRLAPEFSIVEGVRREVDTAIAKGGKQTRTMFEETGRQRRLLMDSVLEGALAMEEDPVIVRVGVGGRKRKGVVGHNFDQG